MSALTLFHVAVSLVAIAAGAGMTYHLLQGRRAEGWTLVYMASTVLTIVTSFFFPFNGFTPALGVASLCLLLLVPTLLARYRFAMAGRWRTIFVIGAIALFYFNSFVLVAQAFQKIPPLHALAPTGSEPPFAVVQLILLLAFLAIGFLCVRRFRPAGIAY